MTTFRPVLQFRRALWSKTQYTPISRSRPTKRLLISNLFRTWPSSFSTPPLRPLPLLLRTMHMFILAHLFLAHVGLVGSAGGPSMLPTLDILAGGLVISKLHARGRGVRVGDMVTYNLPINEDLGVKRVLGMPGDYVLMGTPAADGAGAGAGAAAGDAIIKVPPGHCWLVGDNLSASRDSRHYGPVPLALVRGKVLAQMWPLYEFRVFKNPFDDPDGPEGSPSP